MHNLHKYSVVLLVLLLQWKTFAGLPVEVQSNVNLSLPSNASSDVAPRGANGLLGNPSLQSANASSPLDSVNSANLSGGSPIVRSILDSAPSANVGAAAAPQPQVLGDVAPRNGFNVASVAIDANNPSIIQSRSAFGVNAALNVTGPVAPGLPGLSSGNSSDLAMQPRQADNNPLQMRNGFDTPEVANSSTNSNDSNPFIPSFLKTFGLRRKRDENIMNVTQNTDPLPRLLPEANETSSDLSLRSAFGQPAANGSVAPADNSNVGAAQPPSPTTNVNSPPNLNFRNSFESPGNASNIGAVSPPQGGGNAEVSNSGLMRSQPLPPNNLGLIPNPPAVVPYINVYPLPNVN